MQLNVFSGYTYTLETIIQAGQKNMAMTSVDVRVNPELRPSRLISSVPRYIWRSVVTAARIFITYRPLKFFSLLGAVTFSVGFLIGVRFLTFYFSEDGGAGHIQSLILAATLMVIGFQVIVVGIVADLIAVNRKLLEKIDWQTQNISLQQNSSQTRRQD